MKRTATINLDRMRKRLVTPMLKPLVLAMAGISLGGCGGSDDSRDVRIFSSLDDCKQAMPEQMQQCETAYQNALKQSAESAPRYYARRDCEEDFGVDQCTMQEGDYGGSWYRPAMTGFMVGQMLRRRDQNDQSAPTSAFGSAPLYRSRGTQSQDYGDNRKWLTADGREVAAMEARNARVASDAFDYRRTQIRRSAGIATESRGGFGSMAASKSGFFHSWGG